MNSAAQPELTETNIGRWRLCIEARWSREAPEVVQDPSCVDWASRGLRGFCDLVKMVFTDPS